jgi:sarcosine oxidase, subunit gamma
MRGTLMGYTVDVARTAIGSLHDLRGPAAPVAGALAALGASLPAQPNTSAGAADVLCCWVGPQRWLLLCADGRHASAALAPLAASLATSALDVTDAYAMFAIRGPDAAAILAQASPLDVHPSIFPANGATFTECFGQTALVARRDGGFAVLVDASYADYIDLFLRRARG